jgi:hypothetical protein
MVWLQVITRFKSIGSWRSPVETERHWEARVHGCTEHVETMRLLSNSVMGVYGKNRVKGTELGSS